MTSDSIAVRAVSACYALMAAVTVIATAVGFWLSYAGLHSFAARAGLSGPEAWAWPSSVDLFILAGELGITISVLRDGKTDWRAWMYFAAGAGPSVGFNVLHVTVTAPGWGKYAVAATPPVAAVLALAALMQQVLSLDAALAHLHGRADNPGRSRTHDETAPSDAETAALASLRVTLAAGNPWSLNQLRERFSLTRTQATRVRQLVLAAANGHDSGNDAGGTT
jgi:hypothetical protein